MVLFFRPLQHEAWICRSGNLQCEWFFSYFQTAELNSYLNGPYNFLMLFFQD